MAGVPVTEAAEQGVAGGELSLYIGLHPHQALLSLSFLAHFPKDEGMLVLKEQSEQTEDRGTERAGAELGTSHALSDHIPGVISKGSFFGLRCPNFGEVGEPLCVFPPI